MRIEILSGVNEVAEAAAAVFFAAAQRADDKGHGFACVLSGGTTPLGAYALIAAKADSLDWTSIDLFFGDERCVPVDHADSNYGAVNAVLLKPAEARGARVHRIRGEDNPIEAAAEYDRTLRTFTASRAAPAFDLVFLGLGADGHTASLFPGSTAITEREKLALPVYADALDSWRVTMTPAALSDAHEVVFLVTGGGKADALAHSLHGPRGTNRFPAQAIMPQAGIVRWIVDASAADKLR